MLSKVRFSFAFYPGKLVFFSWNLAWNSLSTVQKTNLLLYLPIKFHADRSKFQFCTTTTRSKLTIIFTRTVLPCLCFFSKSSGRNNAKYAFQYTFKYKSTQYAKKKKKKRRNTVRTFTRTKKPSFARVILILYINYPWCKDCAFSASFVLKVVY